MSERQGRIDRIGAAPRSTSSGSGCVVQVESIDGETVHIDAAGRETVSEIRSLALERLGAVTTNPGKYVVISAEGRVVDERTTLDQLINENEALHFQLLPQAAFGPLSQEFHDAGPASREPAT